MRPLVKTPLILFALLSTLQMAASAQPLPQRWVSAGGAVSEWVVALGGESHLVGVDSTSREPSSLTRLPSIGYQRQLSAEGMLSLRPDVVIGSEEMGPPPVLEQLRNAGVRVEVLSASTELPVLWQNLERIGGLLGAPERAGQAFAHLSAQLDALQRWVTQAGQHQAAPGVLMLVGGAGAQPLVAGSGTVGDWMIRQAGGHNLAVHSGYKAFSPEAMAGLDPQVLVVSDRALNGKAAIQALLRENPVLATTRATREGRLVSLDPTLLVGGVGPRVPQGLMVLSTAFYPGQPAPLLDEKTSR